jgi:hypothetical protein
MTESDKLEQRITALEDRIFELEEVIAESRVATHTPAEMTGELAGVTDDKGRGGVELLQEGRQEDTREELIPGSDTDRVSIRTEVLETINHFESAYGEDTPTDYVITELSDQGYERSDILEEIDTLRRKGEIYEPTRDHVRVV